VCQLEGLAELAGRRQVWSPAQVDELALPVQRDGFARWDARDDLGLVFLADAAEEVDGLVPRSQTSRVIASSRSTISFMRASMTSRSLSVNGSSREKS
jgi:hypothetical protein